MLTRADIEELIERILPKAEEHRARLEHHRAELGKYEKTIEDARSMLVNLPPDLLAPADTIPKIEVMPYVRSVPTEEEVVDSGTPTLSSAIREEIAAASGQFTASALFDRVVEKHPERFRPEQRAAAASIISKELKQLDVRVVEQGAGGRPTIYEKLN